MGVTPHPHYMAKKNNDLKWKDQKHLHGVVQKEDFEFINQINTQTTDHLGEEWIANLRKNIKSFKKHGAVRDCLGLGENKAVIGVGAGSSFAKNKELFKRVVNMDGVNDWEHRDFVTVASNHQFKPLLNMGVLPDFVLMVDAGMKGVYDQLCKDIPEEAQGTTLIAGLHCNPDIVNDWTAQGRPLKYYLNPYPGTVDEFKKLTNENANLHKIELGGNVLNGIWRIGISVFGSTVFMGLGNDLSYSLEGDVDKRREKYYEDGDYTTNAEETGSGRDEAKVGKVWGGFNLIPKKIVTGTSTNDRYDIVIDTVGTSHTLWVYKTWLETAIMSQEKSPLSLHYFNCTEGGILGVMAKSTKSRDMLRSDNWFLLDEKCHKYHTARFKDAVEVFLKAKELMEENAKNAMPIM